MTPRSAAIPACFLLGLLLLGCGRTGPVVQIVHDARAPVAFGVLPFLERASLVEALGPLVSHLSAGLDRPVELRVGASYADLERQMAAGRLDLAWTRTRSTTGPMTVLCKTISRGNLARHGLIVSRKLDGPPTLAALAGRRFLYVDRFSLSGFVYPNRLFQARGIDPLRYFASVGFAGNHERVAQMLLSGAADGGAVTDALLADPLLAAQLRVIEKTEPIPEDPILVRAQAPPQLRARLRDLFVDMNSHPRGREALAKLSRAAGVERFE